MNSFSNFEALSQAYFKQLLKSFTPLVLQQVHQLSLILKDTWDANGQIFICGNGGSAANAIHMANDFHFGIGCSQTDAERIPGLRVSALCANQAIITCLANDIGYEYIYSNQLEVHASSKDVLIVLSGSGNSKNIINALETAKDIGVKSCAILGYSGGLAKDICDLPIHINVNDMQIAEDSQLIIGHLCMQWISSFN